VGRTWMAVIAVAAALVAAAAGPAVAQGTEDGSGPITWEVKKTTVPTAPVKAGGTFTLDIVAHIERGWHLYSLTPIENGPRPTRITIVAGQGFELGGKITAPDPTTAFDPNFKVETEYYEDAVTFSVPIRVLPDAAAGKAAATVQVRYQTCNDKDCLPPALVKLPVSVEIAAK
jgi:DsbC/DsbD-like thiol-disulfide interchange protein